MLNTQRLTRQDKYGFPLKQLPLSLKREVEGPLK
jgi:hypothetical protein